MSNEHYLEGVRAAQAYYGSQGFSNLTRTIRAEDAIKLFWPPVEEYLTQVSSPLPKPRKDWIKGFKEEQINILEDSGMLLDKESDS